MAKEHYDALKKTAANYVPLSPLSFMRRTVDIFGDRPGVIYGDIRRTWAQVSARSRRLAHALVKRGIGEGDTVSVILPNVPAMVEAHFGVPMAGAVLNAINTRLEKETIAYILAHADCKLLIVDAQFAATARAALRAAKLNIPVVRVDDAAAGFVGDNDSEEESEYDAFLATGDADYAWQSPQDEWQALALNYTSGTSGKPKGVVYHHRGSYLMSMGTAAAWQLPLHPVYLYTVPMFHCNGWGHAWTMCLMAGTLVCCRAVSAKAVFDAVADHGVTHLGGAPIVLGMLVNADESEKRRFSHPVKVMTAGAPPPAAILRETEKLGFDVMQVYGLTETYGHVTQCLWKEEWDALAADERADIKSWQGVAFPMTEDIGLIGDDGATIPRGDSRQGEIVIRGNTVMKGYYKDPVADDKAFADGWFHSGDAAVWRDGGYLQIRDRLKDVIISGGENISSVEVENALCRHPAVAYAAVVAKPDDKWGETPCAFVELKTDDADITADALIAFCRGHLAGFKTPKTVVFGALPKTATGKIQKFLLREKAATL